MTHPEYSSFYPLLAYPHPHILIQADAIDPQSPGSYKSVAGYIHCITRSGPAEGYLGIDPCGDIYSYIVNSLLKPCACQSQRYFMSQLQYICTKNCFDNVNDASTDTINKVYFPLITDTMLLNVLISLYYYTIFPDDMSETII